MTIPSVALVCLSFACSALPAQDPPPAPPAAAAQLPEALVKARKLLEAKDLDGAQAAVVEAIEADPDCAPAHTLLREIRSKRVRNAEDRKATSEAMEKLYVDW